MKKIKAILFDFDETLSSGPIEKYIPEAQLRSKFNLSDEQISRLFELDFELLDKFYLPEVSMHITNREKETELHKEVFSIMAEDIKINNITDFVDFMVDYRMNKLIFGLYPEVETVIKELSEKYELHIFTNALPSRAREVKTTNVGKYFKNTYTSNVVGFYKPQEEFYKYVIEELGLEPSEVLLVDDKENLLLPAKALGMNVVLVDRKGKNSDSQISRIQNLEEINQFL